MATLGHCSWATATNRACCTAQQAKTATVTVITRFIFGIHSRLDLSPGRRKSHLDFNSAHNLFFGIVCNKTWEVLSTKVGSARRSHRTWSGLADSPGRCGGFLQGLAPRFPA